MKRLELINNSLSIKQPNFIGLWNIENNNLCNELIKYFEENVLLQKIIVVRDHILKLLLL